MHESSSNQAPRGPRPEGPEGPGAEGPGGVGSVISLLISILAPGIDSQGLHEVRPGRQASARFTAPKGWTRCARAATYGSGSLFSVVTIVPLAEKNLYVPPSYIDFSNYPEATMSTTTSTGTNAKECGFTEEPSIEASSETT